MYGVRRGWARRATIPGQGVFTVNEVTGKITFDPAPAYRGVISIAYRVTDTSGNTAASTVAVTVTPIVPVIADDASATPYETAVTVACWRTTSRVTRRRRSRRGAAD